MKLAKIQPLVLDPDLKTKPSSDYLKKEKEICYVEHKNQAAFKKALDEIKAQTKPWKVWQLPAKGMTPRMKAKVEMYCAGWMAYYDQIVRNFCVDHHLFFEWNDQEDKVSVYISPPQKDNPNYGITPDGFSTDPPDPDGPPPPPLATV